MRDLPLTREALSLAHELFRTRIGASVGGDIREIVAFSHLVQSSQALGAVFLIVSKLGKEALNPAYILVRHMLELAVRLRYLEAHPDILTRHMVELEARLRHLEAHPDKLHSDEPLEWKVPPLKNMCYDLGMHDHYEDIYRWLSGKTHALAHSVFAEYYKLAGHTEVPDWQSAFVVIYAIVYYDMVANVNATIFPNLASNFAKLQSGAWDRRFNALLQDCAFRLPSQYEAPSPGATSP